MMPSGRKNHKSALRLASINIAKANFCFFCGLRISKMAARQIGKEKFLKRLSALLRTKRLSSSFGNEAEQMDHARETAHNWKMISAFVAVPAMAYLTYKNLIVGEHIEPPKEYTAWSHLRIRNKPFPWGDGDKSLFHNPHMNLGPDTVHDEEAEHEPKEPFITWLIRTYLMEDPEETRKWRDEHLRMVRKRCDEYIANRKRIEALKAERREELRIAGKL